MPQERDVPKAWQSWRSIKKGPKQLVELIEAGIKLRDQRKELESKCAALGAEEKALKDFVLDTFDKADLREVKTKAGTARLAVKDVPQAEDWEKIYAHIKKTGEFDLLQKRLGERACQERWDAKVAIPGVKKFHVVTLKLGDAE